MTTARPPTGARAGALRTDGALVRDVLARRAASDPASPFLRFGPDVATYGEVHAAATAASRAVRDVGVEPAELVGVMLANSIAYVELYFGLAYRGAAVVLVNTDFRGYLLEHVLNDAGCRTLLAGGEFLATLAASEDALAQLETIVVVGAIPDGEDPGQAFSRIRVVPLDTLRAAPGEGAPAPSEDAATPGSLHCVVYSSGTTGPSKGIMISNAHALTKADEVLRICAFTPEDVLYSPLPLFYSMGLLRGVLSVALVGSSIVLRDRFSVSAFWEDVRAHSATVAHCVFSIPRMLATVPEAPDDHDNSLRCMFNAQHDAEFERRFGVTLVESYGLTEAGNAIYNRLGEPVVKGSCGRVSDDWEVRLADASGREVPVGETGELLLRPREPASVMLGYLHQPDATAAAFRDLWLHTGDLARRDADGFYYYQGRTKDVIRRRGQNISAWEVEEILRSHPDVGEAAALARPSDVGEDDLRVVLVASEEGVSLDLVAIGEFCERRMPAFMVPRYLEQVAALPRTPSGRVEKYKLDRAASSSALDRGSARRR
ncbi:MAG TPA: AMP-binding protein [Acidimicrobiales bacterium]|nr:AMP-binding protein [Acidimicrobiales bacterium]